MRQKKHRLVIIGIMLLIAVIHIIGPGRYLPGQFSNLFSSYFSDFILPFGFYFLFGILEEQSPPFRRWQVKLGFAIAIPAVAETLQFFGIDALGVTFDPLDYVMYACGAACAALVDTQIFPHIFSFWGMENTEEGIKP